MNLSNLRPAEGSRKKRKRRGRGPGSGLGKTSGRGHKGQLSGSGYSRKRGFEGGQMPLVRRVPKRGFTNIFRTEYVALNLDSLAKMKKDEISFDDLLKAGLVRKRTDLVKVLGRGEIKSAVTVHAHRFSRSAQKKIEEKGGKTVTIGKD
jgi:large subunit ribosomal protein L15